MDKCIVFTGGGSGGHVMPALTLIQRLCSESSGPGDDGVEIQYIGSFDGIERELVSQQHIPYHAISTGKLRRYLSLQNFYDIFKIIAGWAGALRLLWRLPKKRTLVFSTGGFVSVPVVVAAKCLSLPVFIHEQTTRIGLANRIASRFADKVFISFEDSRPFFPAAKTHHSGYPLRKECFSKEISKVELDGQTLNDADLPIVFITGGGNGSKLINDFFKPAIKTLTEKFIIVHQVGKLFYSEFTVFKSKHYFPLAFIGAEMIDLMKLATVVISRAGAGTVSELMALNKASIFIPLKIAQHNEQFHNAKEAERRVGSKVIEEDQLSAMEPAQLLEDFVNAPNVSTHIQTEDACPYLIEQIHDALK